MEGFEAAIGRGEIPSFLKCQGDHPPVVPWKLPIGKGRFPLIAMLVYQRVWPFSATEFEQ